MKRNRWLIALSAVGIHICIGSVYAWSVLTKPVMAAMRCCICFMALSEGLGWEPDTLLRYQLWLSGFQGTEDLPQVWPSWGLVLPH